MTRKDEMELAYWKKITGTNYATYHEARLGYYLWQFGNCNMPKSVLEIGTGPFGGVLPQVGAAAPYIPMRLLGIDPLYSAYEKAGLLKRWPGIEYLEGYFEDFQTDERFDAIFAIDSLDHGEMGTHLLPKIIGLLNPGGRLYLHLHFRPKELLNAIHDHSMTREAYDAAIDASAPVNVLMEQMFLKDVDDTWECPTLMTVLERKA